MELIIIIIVLLLLIILIPGSKKPNRQHHSEPATPRQNIANTMVYTIDLTVNNAKSNSSTNHGQPQHDISFPEISELLTSSELTKVRSNLNLICQRHGNDQILVIDQPTLSGVDFDESHTPLLIGDEILLDIKNAYVAPNFISIPTSLKSDHARLFGITLTDEDPAYNIIDTIKITGAYVADMRIWPGFPTHSNKLIIFYKADSDGGDNDNTPDPLSPEHRLILWSLIHRILSPTH